MCISEQRRARDSARKKEGARAREKIEAVTRAAVYKVRGNSRAGQGQRVREEENKSAQRLIIYTSLCARARVLGKLANSIIPRRRRDGDNSRGREGAFIVRTRARGDKRRGKDERECARVSV